MHGNRAFPGGQSKVHVETPGIRAFQDVRMSAVETSGSLLDPSRISAAPASWRTKLRSSTGRSTFRSRPSPWGRPDLPLTSMPSLHRVTNEAPSQRSRARCTTPRVRRAAAAREHETRQGMRPATPPGTSSLTTHRAQRPSAAGAILRGRAGKPPRSGGRSRVPGRRPTPRFTPPRQRNVRRRCVPVDACLSMRARRFVPAEA